MRTATLRTAALRAAASGTALFAAVVLSGCAGGPAGQPADLAVPAPNVSVPAPADVSGAPQDVQNPPAAPAEVQPPAQVPAPPEPKLSEQQAQEIALGHAKASGKTAIYCNIDYDSDHAAANPEWDCEFIVGDYEYGYEIDAVTGEIVNYERESVWD